MTRIFTALAIFALGLLLTNLMIGLTGGDYNGATLKLREAHRELDLAHKNPLVEQSVVERLETDSEAAFDRFVPLRRWATLHILLGVLAALVTVLVSSIGVTYFIGTGRWCQEVVDTYHLDAQFIARSHGLKRRTFPHALVGMLAVLGIVACGAAADPGTLREGTGQWVTPHLVVAFCGVTLIGACLVVQMKNIGLNHEVIDQILEEVRRVRTERGMDVEGMNEGGSGKPEVGRAKSEEG